MSSNFSSVCLHFADVAGGEGAIPFGFKAVQQKNDLKQVHSSIMIMLTIVAADPRASLPAALLDNTAALLLHSCYRLHYVRVCSSRVSQTASNPVCWLLQLRRALAHAFLEAIKSLEPLASAPVNRGKIYRSRYGTGAGQQESPYVALPFSTCSKRGTHSRRYELLILIPGTLRRKLPHVGQIMS